MQLWLECRWAIWRFAIFRRTQICFALTRLWLQLLLTVRQVNWPWIGDVSPISKNAVRREGHD
jgi:hypothetical protein